MNEENDSDVLKRIGEHYANEDAAKKDTQKPCRLCGWGEHMQIHKNGNEGFFHTYREKQNKAAEVKDGK